MTKTIDLTYDDIVDALYARLEAVHRALAVSVAYGDDFDAGINCRLANEQYWLQDLLDKVEKSR
jgi:hypothetical protein